MRQVTGSNPSGSANKVSIQLALDGHSFCVAGPESDAQSDVEVGVLTPRTLLVPQELFAPGLAGALLAAAGMPATAGDRIVWSAPKAEVVAVMAAGSEAIEAVVTKSGGRARFTTPLLGALQADMPTVWILRTAGLLYIKVYDDSLRMAEVIPAPSDADVLFLAERLSTQYTLAGFLLRAAGTEAAGLRKLIGKRFKTTVCEL